MNLARTLSADYMVNQARTLSADYMVNLARALSADYMVNLGRALSADYRPNIRFKYRKVCKMVMHGESLTQTKWLNNCQIADSV